MKKEEKLARALNDVDEELLAKAAPAPQQRKKRPKWQVVLLAACLAGLLLAGGLWMFIPFSTALPDISAHKNSPYYGLMVKLNEATYVKPAFKNNFEKYIKNIFKGATAEDDGAPEAGNADGTYQEVTDNQVSGVIEGDVFKRTDSHIFYLDAGVLTAYSIAGSDSVKVGSLDLVTLLIHEEEYSRGLLRNNKSFEMFLSADGKTATVLVDIYDTTIKQNKVVILAVDVTDPTAMIFKDKAVVTGSYLSARMVNGDLLLMNRFSVSSNPDFSKEERFLPQIDVGEGLCSLPLEDIVFPDTLTNVSYTVISMWAGDTLDMMDACAYLSYNAEVYVTGEDIFVTRTFGEDRVEEGSAYRYRHDVSEICRISYGANGLEKKGSYFVDGSVKNQYSMDVYEGVFRVVTTTEMFLQTREENGVVELFDSVGETNVNLYCISMETGEILGSVIGFAPAGESAESVRFDGTKAYVCTALVATLEDPVYFFDLSDLSNITYKDTGVIEGYSTSLVQLGDGYLLGIGYGENSGTLKIEIYRESEDGVVSVCKYEEEGAAFDLSYKAYYINREENLIGIGITRYREVTGEDKNGSIREDGRYILLHFDGYDLNTVLDEEVNGTDYDKRGILIDECFYILGTGIFKVIDLGA